MPRESKFEAALIDDLQRRYPGAIILKNDPNLLQGFPDRLILFRDRWAAFEVKASEMSSVRPNQAYYVEALKRMSYASFVYPENLEDFLYELQQALRSRRSTRVP
jgi:hypothetical protein